MELAEHLGNPLAGLSMTAQRILRRMARTPPDILITTPESLFLMLTSRAREVLRSVDTVIIAQEILVDNAAYPTEKIAKNSHDFRPLGLGYAISLGVLHR